MYRPEKPAPTTTASNWSETEAGLFTRRSLVVPELGKGVFDGVGAMRSSAQCDRSPPATRGPGAWPSRVRSSTTPAQITCRPGQLLGSAANANSAVASQG